MNSPLLTIKINVPILRDRLVKRTGLIRRLTAGVKERRKLTLVSAPPVMERLNWLPIG